MIWSPSTANLFPFNDNSVVMGEYGDRVRAIKSVKSSLALDKDIQELLYLEFPLPRYLLETSRLHTHEIFCRVLVGYRMSNRMKKDYCGVSRDTFEDDVALRVRNPLSWPSQCMWQKQTWGFCGMRWGTKHFTTRRVGESFWQGQ